MTFDSLFTNIAKSFKVNVDKPVIDDFVFRCHYKLTTSILSVFCVLITSINLIGNPIECITNFSKNAEMQKVINTYCLMSGSYTHQNNKLDFRQTGVAGNEESIRFHSYYQWVPFMLFFQALSFYVPHWIWKMWEGRKISMITNDMRGFCLESVQDRRAKQNKLVLYFVESFNTHSAYALGYVVCETINAVNVIGNIYVTDKFLGESFLAYGPDVLGYYRGAGCPRANSPMDAVFPRLAKCDFFKYGPSGTVQTVDAMCVLAQNALNDKIYFILWVWFFALAVVSALTLCYRFANIVQIATKTTATLQLNAFDKFVTLNRMRAPTFPTKFQVGDLLLLNFIEKNVNHVQFKEIFEEICTRLDNRYTFEAFSLRPGPQYLSHDGTPILPPISI